MSRRGERFTDDEIARNRRLASERRTDEEIGLLLGRGGPSIKLLRARLRIEAGGGTYDPARTVDPELVERIRTLAGSGWSDERIGRSVGRTRTQIMRLRNRFEIPAGNPQFSGANEGQTVAAEARRDAHVRMLRERRAKRQAVENV